MNCISLWQPWASLVVGGAKKWETRSWSTRKRGRIAIHAAKKWNDDLRTIAGTCPFSTALHALGLNANSLLFGYVLGEVTLIDCVPVESVTPSPDERAFGDYSPGRFAWILADPIIYKEPMQQRGAQGIFGIHRYPNVP